MEIERKFLINMEQLPFRPEDFPCRHIEQGYLCTAPVVRIRRDNEEYFLTYKSKGLMVREEYNLPLTKEAYTHLIPKADGRMIRKNVMLSLWRMVCLWNWIFSRGILPLLYWQRSSFRMRKARVPIKRRTGLERM